MYNYYMAPTKFCKYCDTDKPISEFHRHPNGSLNVNNKCKVCTIAFVKAWQKKRKELALNGDVAILAKLERQRQQQEDWRKKIRQEDPERIRRSQRNTDIRRRGIEPEQYDAMLAFQNGVCAICGLKEENKNLAVDHDHRCCGSGRKGCARCFRGLLCTPCNTLLQRLDFTPQWIGKALQYLQQHERPLNA